MLLSLYNATEKAYIESMDLSAKAIDKAEAELLDAAAHLDGNRVEMLSEYINLLRSYNDPETKVSKKKSKAALRKVSWVRSQPAKR